MTTKSIAKTTTTTKKGAIRAAKRGAARSLRELADQMLAKSADIYWLSQLGENGALECAEEISDILSDPADSRYERVNQILRDHGEEAEEVAQGDLWFAGYHAGYYEAAQTMLDQAAVLEASARPKHRELPDEEEEEEGEEEGEGEGEEASV